MYHNPIKQNPSFSAEYYPYKTHVHVLTTKGGFKRSKLFFQTEKKTVPKSLKLNLFILKDVT